VLVVALVPAAGSGSRLGGPLPKPFVLLRGRPLLAHTLYRLEQVPIIEGIVVVVAPDFLDACRREVIAPACLRKVIAVVPGGADRQASVAAGLAALPAWAEVVLVHDGARPLVPVSIVEAVARAAAAEGAALAAVRPKDTVKLDDGGRDTAAAGVPPAAAGKTTPGRDPGQGEAHEAVSLPRRALDDPRDSGGYPAGRPGADSSAPWPRVAATLDRSRLWLAQTPQGFRVALLREAHARAAAEGVEATDDAHLVERLGHPVVLVPGSYRNLKVTTREDLLVAEALLAEEALAERGGEAEP
jgi:2-C-methyl-D-erythritol 4-phosphate cytidylyltransferase